MPETTTVTIDPDAIFKAETYVAKLRQVGHEAASLSPWLQVELQQRGIPAICPEARHARAAMRYKTEQADALGIAHIVRTGRGRFISSASKAIGRGFRGAISSASFSTSRRAPCSPPTGAACVTIAGELRVRPGASG